MNLDEALNNIGSGVELLDPLKDTDKIYHYTSTLGLKGIIEGGNFWLTHSNFMNDSSEFKYTYQLILDELEKMKELENEGLHEMYDLLKNQICSIMEKENSDEFRIIRSNLFRPSEYILSFSLNKDSMQLWSTFSKCDGYNIGINLMELINGINEKNEIICIPSKVVYEPVKQRNILQIKINEFRNVYKNNKNYFNEENKTRFSSKFSSSIRLYCNFFKSPAFSGEEEFRIIFYNFKKNTNPKYKHVTPYYRNRGNVLIPYINLKNRDIVEYDLLPIHSITVGPTNHSDIAKEGVAYFLNDLGYNLDHIEIKNSKIPLRY